MNRAMLSVGCCLLLVFFLCGFKFMGSLKNEEGNRYYKKGQVGKAKSAYSEALKADPASRPIAFNLGNTYYREEDYGSSAELYQKATVEGKDVSLKSHALYNLGNSLAQRRQNEKAIESYKEALRLDPGDKDAKYNLEMLLKRDQDQEKKDEKKDDKKEDKKEDQKKESKPQKGGSSGSDQQPKDDQGEQGKQEKKESAGGQGEKEEQAAGKQEEEGSQEKKDSQAQGGGGQEEQPEEKQEKSPAAGSAEEKKKSDLEKRAEQILNALGDHEQQVLKLSGDRKRLARPRRISEKDW